MTIWSDGYYLRRNRMEIVGNLLSRFSSGMPQPFGLFRRGESDPEITPIPAILLHPGSPLRHLRLIPSFRLWGPFGNWRGRGFLTLKNLTCVCVANRSFVSFGFYFVFFSLFFCCNVCSFLASSMSWPMQFKQWHLHVFSYLSLIGRSVSRLPNRRPGKVNTVRPCKKTII